MVNCCQSDLDLIADNLKTALWLIIMKIKVGKLVVRQNYPVRDYIWVAPDR